MKPVLKISMYFGILAGFALATGFPQFLYNTKDVKTTATTFSTSELKTLKVTPENFSMYFDTLIESRKKLAAQDKYSAWLYFYDLNQSLMFKHKYKDFLPSPNRFNGGRTSIDQVNNELWAISVEEVRRGTVTDLEINKARNHWLEGDKPQAPPIPNGVMLSSFIAWLLRFYLQGLPVAFVLFLIWKITLKKDFDEEFRWDTEKPQMYFGIAPFSFLVSLLLWPIVLGIDMYNKFEETLRRADVVSRRGKLLSLFSKQEEQLFELGKKMTRIEFRTYLDSIGVVQKHSFTSALLVTLFLIIVPTSMFAQTTSTNHKEKVIMMKSDYGGGGIHYDVVAKSSAVLNYGDDVKQFPEFVKLIFYITDWLYEYVFVPDIGKVPLVLNRVLVTLI